MSNAAGWPVTMRLGPEHDQIVAHDPETSVDGSTGEPQTMAELLAEVEREERAFRPLRTGETVEGTIAGISGDEVLVDLAGHSAGVLSLREASAALDEPLEVGDTGDALA